MINAFLSYRHNNAVAKLARDHLKTLCKVTDEIELVYDEDVTEEGDSLIAFMEDLVDARCVFIFLAPNYFESSYTLFELISVNEQEGLDKRFIHPIRLTNEVSTYEKTHAKTYWDENKAIRNEVVRLLQKTGRLGATPENDHDAIWVRVTQAWNNLIENPLDHLKSAAVEGGQTTDVLEKCVEQVIPTIQKVKEDQKQELQKVISQKIKEVLDKGRIPLLGLAYALDDPKGEAQESSESLADYLTQSGSEVVDLLSAVIEVLEDRKESLGEESDAWQDCFYDGEQIAGWLVLLSVCTEWWFENSHTLTKKSSDGLLDELVIDTKEYAEVVISRSLLQKVQFKTNEVGGVDPLNKKNNILMVYDANSKQAKERPFLHDIYLDLMKKKPPEKLDNNGLLKSILTRAKNYKKNAKGKAIYYLVSEETKKMLETFEWYKEGKANFGGCLHFICCESSPQKPYNKAASTEDQETLLDQYAILLQLNEF